MASEHTTSPSSTNANSADEAIVRERDELRDRLLRTAAEFDNYRKRTERERREQAEYAAADLIRDLLPVVDDLERAVAAPVEPGPGAERIAAYRGGLDLIRRQFLEVLKRRGVAALDVVGQPFDPQWHEALAQEPADGRPDGEITAEIRRGYRLGQRLLRAALVKVAQA
ncbi:MAG TPA: nucleotide exchange factor GrpE [Vicinamibacterales bacterium]|jgi:molecular chaperone GrpE|nr:nucleotide exchange factor GrpE [Vicinamibacterales bacterium]